MILLLLILIVGALITAFYLDLKKTNSLQYKRAYYFIMVVLALIAFSLLGDFFSGNIL
jgi:formate hydrogenlyase subunit 3/multisubunit Na+/H+ antiporter MnhD subunit